MRFTKLIRKYFLSPPLVGWGILLLLISCQKEITEEFIPEDTEIRFSFNITVPDETRVSTNKDFKTTFDIDDEVGLYLVRSDTSLKSINNYANNVKLKYNGTSWDSEQPLYHTNLPNGSLRAYMYYPYKASIDPINLPFQVQTAQDIEENYNRSDFLLAYSEYIQKSGTPVQMTFRHALCLIYLTLEGTVPEPETTVILTGGYTSAIFNLDTQFSSRVTDRENISMYRIEQPGSPEYKTSFTYRALVPEQNLTPGFRIQSGDTQYFVSFDTVILKKGKIKSYIVNIN